LVEVDLDEAKEGTAKKTAKSSPSHLKKNYKKKKIHEKENHEFG